MRILLDWAARANGDLLALARGSFATDQRLSYQQAVSSYGIAVVVLVARRNKIGFLRRLVPELLRVLRGVKAGRIYRVGE